MQGLFPRLLACIMVTASCLFLAPDSAAQSCSSPAGPSLHDLQMSVQQPAFHVNRFQWQGLIGANATFSTDKAKTVPKQGIFLPHWSAEDLPFFCKIEHDWAKNRARIPVKFRLGSVEYVDWLEGKTDMPGY